MEENKTIFNYITQLFATYGIMVAIFMVFGMTIGNLANGHSSLFALGTLGFSTETLFQLLLLATIITLAQITFLTDRWIKNMGLILRNICFFGCIVIVMAVFAAVFVWFPIKEVKAWIGFGVSFLSARQRALLSANWRKRQRIRKCSRHCTGCRRNEGS